MGRSDCGMCCRRCGSTAGGCCAAGAGGAEPGWAGMTGTRCRMKATVSVINMAGWRLDYVVSVGAYFDDHPWSVPKLIVGCWISTCWQTLNGSSGLLFCRLLGLRLPPGRWTVRYEGRQPT